MIQYQGIIKLDNDKSLIIAMGDLDNGYCYSDIEKLKIDIKNHAYREGIQIIDMNNKNLDWNNIEAIDTRDNSIAAKVKGYSIKKREVSDWGIL